MVRAIDDARGLMPWQRVVTDIACEIGRIDSGLGESVAQLPKTAFGVESGFFYLPIAQAIAWEENDPQWLRQMAVVFGLGHLYYVLHDHLVDTGALEPHLAVLMDVVLVRYLRGGTQLGVAPAEFLDAHERATAAYARALQRDLAHRRRRTPYSAEEVYLLGEKAAPAKLIMLILATRHDRHADLPSLTAALTWMCSGLQLLDDIQDLRQDLADGNLTFPLTLGLSALADGAAGGPTTDHVTADDVLDALYLSGGAAAALRIASRCLDRAGQVLASTDATVIEDLLGEWTARARRQLDRAVVSAGHEGD